MAKLIGTNKLASSPPPLVKTHMLMPSWHALNPRLTSWLVQPFTSFEAAQSSRTKSVFVFSKKKLASFSQLSISCCWHTVTKMYGHPLFLGLGRLPDWLRNKHGVLSLDTYEDNLCLFRCIAVHQGATPKRNMRKTRELEKSFFTQRPDLRNRLTDKHLSLLEKHFKQGIAAYEVQPNGDFILTHVPANYAQVGIPLLNMGLYYGHAFLITDLKQVANTYTCGDCQARFTQSCHLARHVANNCSRGQTKINCLNNRIKAPSSVYERAFYPEQTCSFVAIKWLEWEAKNRGIHIHHARCGHGGERKILGARVDGYHQESKTVFQFHGCLWHGCEKCYPEDRQKPVQQNTRQGKVISRLDTEKKPMNRKTAYELGRGAFFWINTTATLVFWSCRLLLFRECQRRCYY